MLRFYFVLRSISLPPSGGIYLVPALLPPPLAPPPSPAVGICPDMLDLPCPIDFFRVMRACGTERIAVRGGLFTKGARMEPGGRIGR